MTEDLPRSSLRVLHGNNWTYSWVVGPTLSPLRVAALLVVWYTCIYLACWYDGALTIPDHVGLLSDKVMYSLLVLLVALTLGTRYLLVRFEILLENLPSLVRWEDHSDEAVALAKRIARIRSIVALQGLHGKVLHGLVLGFFFLLVLFFQIYIPHAFPQRVSSWALMPDRYPVAYIVATLWAFFYWVLLVGNPTWYGLSSAILIQRLLRHCTKQEALVVTPLAPDRKGGLGVLADYHHSVTLLASSGMVFVVAWLVLFGANLPWLLGFLVYVAALSLLYFLPLTSVHKAMQSAQTRELKRLSSLSTWGHKLLPSSPHSPSEHDSDAARAELQQTVAYLASIDSLYRRAESMPVWPLNPRMLTQFLTIVLIPFALWIVQVSTADWVTRTIQAFFQSAGR